MGILDDFIKNIKEQRERAESRQEKTAEDRAREENEAQIRAARAKEEAAAEKESTIQEQARRENEAKIREAREREASGKSGPANQGVVGGVIERMKEQRRQFEEASKGPKPKTEHAEIGAPQGPVIQEQKPDVISAYGYNFTHLPGQQPHVFFDDGAKAVFIDDVDEYKKAGGKVEQRDITAAMDPYMYNIYTKKGGPLGQARYYKASGTVVSMVPDPFVRYR